MGESFSVTYNGYFRRCSTCGSYMSPYVEQHGATYTLVYKCPTCDKTTAINSVPMVQPIDNPIPVESEWIEVKTYDLRESLADFGYFTSFKCAKCKKSLAVADPMIDIENKLKFCPFCGGKMKRKEEKEN